MRLAEKTAIVTGAAHGIGLAIAELFAKEGARVVLADVDRTAGRAAASRIQRRGGYAIFVYCDVAKARDAKSAVRLAVGLSDHLDILCNNAAYLSRRWNCSGTASPREWERSFQVSLLGAQNLIHAALPSMVEAASGSIINISSVQGLVAGRNAAAYTAVKHGLIGLTRSVACDYGAHNIRCNALCPGAITTRISPKPGSELYRRQVSKTLLGRVGTAAEVARAAVFLASEDSSYVTGAVLPVDGGWTAI